MSYSARRGNDQVWLRLAVGECRKRTLNAYIGALSFGIDSIRIRVSRLTVDA